jgi:dienelactone hydrolase
MRVILSIAIFLSLILVSPMRAQEKTAPATPAVEQPQAVQLGMKTDHTPEDFSSLSLVGSELVAMPPFPGGHEENKDFIRELYQVQWRSQDPIDLFVIRPAGVKNPPVVLYLSSFPSDIKRYYSADVCRRLVSHGAAAVGFVSALTGDRFHRPMKQWFISELQESLGTTVHDVQMILNYLDTRGDLDMSHVGMLGQGSGGAIAILAAAADPRIKAIDLINPWGDWPDFLADSKLIPAQERPDYLKPEFLKKVEPLEPVHYLPSLKTQAVRIQFVDEKPPTKWATSIEKAAPAQAEIHHYSSAEELRPASANGELFQWIAGRLKPAAQPVAPAPAQPSAPSEKKGTQQ